MPGTGLMNVKVLGEGTEYSKEMFGKLFLEPAKMPRFKHYVSTSPDRFKNRAFSAETTFSESFRSVLSGKTNYPAILRELLTKEHQGSLSLVGNFSFLINASHAAVRAKGPSSLSFMASGQTLVTPADYLHQPLHRLLVEEHVYAFVWAPTLSHSYHALMAAVALAKLATATVSTVATFGAAAPALIASLQSAADVAQDLIKLKTRVSEAVTHLQTLAGELETTAGHLSEARTHLSALGGAGDTGSEHLMPGSPAMLDPAAASIAPAPKRVKRAFGLLGSRMQTEREAARDARTQLASAEAEIQKLNFVVVQQITPVVQLRDNVEVTSATSTVMNFNHKTYIAKKALVRVGETSRDRFNQMVAAAKLDSLGRGGLAELFLRPWHMHDTYLQYMRAASELQAGSDPRPAGASTTILKWDHFPGSDWELVDEKPATQPIPSTILATRAKLEATVRARMAAAQAQQNQMLRGWISRTRTHMTSRLEGAEKARLSKIIGALSQAKLPTKDEFKSQTTTTSFGLFTNTRNNPKLALIDAALVAWAHVNKADASDAGIHKMKEALLRVQVTCEDYLQSKVHASRKLTGHLSERVAPVERVRQAAIRIHDALP